MKNSKNIFLGVLGAAVVGVVVGILVAPEKGKNVRKHLKGSAGDLAKKLGKLLEHGKEQFDELTTKALEEAESLKQEASSAYKKIKSSM